MTNNHLLQIALYEISSPTLDFTQQFLNRYKLKIENDVLKLFNTNNELFPGSTVFFFKHEYKDFYLAIQIGDATPHNVISSWVEPRYSTWFRAMSEDLNFSELSAYTKISPNDGWTKGDPIPNRTVLQRFSAFFVEPDAEIMNYNAQLESLLNILETDSEGIVALTHASECTIRVTTTFFKQLGVPHRHTISATTLKRLHQLNLEIDFDVYCVE